MDLLQITILALIQGLTEFLPISSSGHLILAPILFDWKDQGLAFDVAVHIGTLAAVVFYFRQDIVNLFKAWLGSFQGQYSAESRLAWGVIIATIPAVVAGLLLRDFIEMYLRSGEVIAWATIGFGILLGFADWSGKRERDEYSLTWKDILVIGFAQALALIPGTSRSGITMTAGLMLGLTRQAAARFSFLLSIPLILASGLYESKKLIESPQPTDWTALILGAVIAAMSAYLCIHFFLRLLERIGMMPFVVYRLLLGVFLLFILA